MIPGTDFAELKQGRLTKHIQTITAWLRKQHEKGIHIASIYSGTLVLAEAGLLNGRNCTSHWKCIDYIDDHYPKPEFNPTTFM